MAESKQVFKSLEKHTVKVNQRRSYVLSKRIIDVVLSFIGLILLLPVFLVVGFLIKLEDKNGSVIFRQERVGKDGKTFSMYKFRSMVANAEDLLENLYSENEANGPLFKMREDPRVTRVGKFIRKTSLDELPQLINVLKGEMSLVGPRPALPIEVAEYNNYQRQRLKVVPGLTCYWQVGGRSNLSFEEQINLDLRYIENCSLIVDFNLIIKTFRVLFGSKDAF
ncbi:sugar transferase [Terribacillus saccharophilus]|uniref:Multidrug MFS transporter n=1 Tax=Terribacillus saccharophilus TaxID=361277 RepID=A0A268AEU3_9BACI|nr:sugar transferase [Terribacillus saccharophilus]PAD22643.1 multidrug MFS transporter [Terribacillus saccharophilus]